MKKTFFLSLVLLFSSGCRESDLQKADEALRRKDFAQAIKIYQRHISERLKVKDRPDWENPYFHLLSIGDIQLGRGDVDQALASYEQAEKEGVDKGMISDRYRFVASWYEKKGDLEGALKVLTKYQNRDDLLFSLMLDRIAKELVKREEATKE